MVLFHPIDEKDVTKAIVGGFMRQIEEYAESDVIIVGGGPSGLMSGKDIASRGIKTLIVECNNYISGGFWIGDYLMNKVAFGLPLSKPSTRSAFLMRIPRRACISPAVPRLLKAYRRGM